jgi:hypothetical protein
MYNNSSNCDNNNENFLYGFFSGMAVPIVSFVFAWGCVAFCHYRYNVNCCNLYGHIEENKIIGNNIDQFDC